MLAGRAAEIDRLTAGLRAAASGQTVAFALVGEPGIGKTRLATELADRARAEGFRVCWGRAWEAGGAPAFWLWRQLLEAAGVPASLEAVELASGSREFSASDPEQARFAQFHQVATALGEAASRGPLFCVLDDLHAADLASIELAAFVLRTLRGQRLFLLCSFRDREANQQPLREAMGRIAREAEVLVLQRLSADESAALVREAMGEHGQAIAGTLHRATSGNPLFLVETLRSLALAGSYDLGELPVAEGITGVVRQRTARLSAEQRAVLGAGAAVGREGPIELWADAVGISLRALEAQLGALIETGLVSRGAGGMFSFSHALVRDAVYLELSDGARLALHERLARALDARVASGERKWVESRAHHALLAAPEREATVEDSLRSRGAGGPPAPEGGVVEAGSAIPAEQAASWVLDAAALLRARAAWEEAAALLARARAGLTASAAVQAELALAEGWALGDAGQSEAMRERFRAVAAQGRQRHDPALFARAVLGIGSHYVFGDTQVELLALIDEALAALGADHPALHARLTARKAAAMTPAPEAESALSLARAAVKEAHSAEDPRAQLDVAVAAGSALGEFAHAEERVPVNLELVRLARELGEPVLQLRGLSRLVVDHFELGDLARAEAFTLEFEQLAQALHLPRLGWPTPLFRSMRAMAAGDFDACAASLASVRTEGDPRVLAVHAFWLSLLRDDLEAMERVLAEALRATASVRSFSVMIAGVACVRRGDLEGARRELAAFDPRLPGLQSTVGLTTMAEVALAAGSLPHARTAFEMLKPRAHLNPTWGPIGFVLLPPVSMTLGNLACALGELDSAPRYFEAALARAASMRAAAHEAWVRFWYGSALLGPLRSPQAGQQLLEQVRANAVALGMPGLAQHAVAKLAMPGLIQPAATALERTAPRPSAAPELLIEPQGSDWIVRRGERQVLVPNMKGMPMLAELVAHPNEELHALALVGEGEGVADSGDAGEVLDDEAKAAYRARMRDLAERIEDAEELGNADRAEAAREELEALRRELSRAVGIGGRDRRALAGAERARVAAHRRLRDAIKRISQADPELGAWIDAAVRTGTYCCFSPHRPDRSSL
jgi:hypothetical protein